MREGLKVLSFGVFLKPLDASFGWKRVLMSGALSVSVALSGLASILSGRLSDRGSHMFPLAPGVLIAALSLWCLGSLWKRKGDCSYCLGLEWV